MTTRFARDAAHFIATGLALSALAGSAAAADLGGAPVYADHLPAYRAPNWTGLYVGINGGYGWSRVKAAGDAGIDGDGFVAGFHGGYNHQIRSLVLGVEGDFNWADVRGREVLSGLAVIDTNHRNMGSVRGRLGFAFDRALVYGTVGYGWTSVRLSETDAFGAASRTKTNEGLVWGGGVEYKLQPNISVRAEALRYEASSNWLADFGSRVRIDTPVTEVRVGLTWHVNAFR